MAWLNPAFADPAAPLSWRQDAALSGYNMLALGIVHETLLRWVPPPVRRIPPLPLIILFSSPVKLRMSIMVKASVFVLFAMPMADI